MVYNKAVADVIVFNNTDVVRTSNYKGVEYTSESSLLDLLRQMRGWSGTAINDALKAISHSNSAANAWKDLAFLGVEGAQNVADTIHNYCRTFETNSLNYSQDIEADSFDEEWDDNETDW